MHHAVNLVQTHVTWFLGTSWLSTFSKIAIVSPSLPYWYAMCGSDMPCVPVVGTGNVTTVLSLVEKDPYLCLLHTLTITEPLNHRRMLIIHN